LGIEVGCHNLSVPVDTAPVPLPGAMPLLLGALALGWGARRRAARRA
jgi:hypothetical protein